jgi:L-amino acid N-acyltransferase YncA
LPSPDKAAMRRQISGYRSVFDTLGETNPWPETGDSVRIVKLSTKYRSAFEVFLSKLDGQTTYDYTHFGYRIENPAKTADIVLSDIAAGSSIGYVILDKKGILGYGHLDSFARREKRHVVKLGIVLHQNYQDRGLGSKLLRFMIADATKMGIEKIWLATYADNQRALELYLSKGFIVEGVFRKEEKVRRRYRDIISMALFLRKTDRV